MIMPILRFILMLSSNRPAARTRPTSPSLPLLTTHSNQPVEQLISQDHGSQVPVIALLVNDLQTIGHLTIQRPAYNKLRFPTQTADFLQLFDVSNGDGPDRVQVRVSLILCTSLADRFVQ